MIEPILCQKIIFVNDSNEPRASISLVEDRLKIEALPGLAGIDFGPVAEFTVTAGDYLKLSSIGDFYVNAGGTGFTYSAGTWEHWFPSSGQSWLPDGPEHPRSGGISYTWQGAT